MNLENFPNQSQTIQDSNKVSQYNGNLTKENLAIQTARILKIFPKFPVNMLDELKEAFIDNKFTDERVKDAIDYVRDHYEGWDKLPNIANFVRYDKTINLYTYNEVLNKVNAGESMANYKIYENDKRFWIKTVREF